MPKPLQWITFVAVLVLLYFVFIKGTGTGSVSTSGSGNEPLANKIHTYLGTNQGDDSTKWTGLTGNLKQHTRDVRGALDDLNCRVHMLEQKLTTRPSPCPPGPPGTVPKNPPGYP
jgi:hypothetical protein